MTLEIYPVFNSEIQPLNTGAFLNLGLAKNTLGNQTRPDLKRSHLPTPVSVTHLTVGMLKGIHTIWHVLFNDFLKSEKMLYFRNKRGFVGLG